MSIRGCTACVSLVFFIIQINPTLIILDFYASLCYSITTRKNSHTLLPHRTSFGTSLLLSSRVRPLNIPSVDLTRSKRCDNDGLICQQPHAPLTYTYIQQEEGLPWKPVSIKPRRLLFQCSLKGWCLSTRRRGTRPNTLVISTRPPFN